MSGGPAAFFEGPLRTVARALCRHPGKVLAGALGLTLVAAGLITQLSLTTDVVDLLPRGHPQAAAYARFAKAFGTEQALVVLAQGDDAARLRRFADAYAQALQRSSLVRGVRYRVGADAAALLRRHAAVLLDDEDYDELESRVAPAALAARARRLRGLAQGFGGGAALERLTRDPLELLPLLARRLGGGRNADPESGYFASRDGRALLLFVTPTFAPADLEQGARLLAFVRATAAQLHREHGTRVRLTGAPAYHLAYATMLRGDLVRSSVFSLVAVLLLFALFFRVLRILPWIALTLGLGVTWTFGAAALLFERVGAISLAFAAIILGIGIDVPVQLYNRIREELAHRAPREAVAASVEALITPATVAAGGTAAVFAACALSQFRGLAELGALTAVGLILILVATVGVLPALLLTLPAGAWLGTTKALPRPRLLSRLGAALGRRPNAFVGGALVCCLVGAPLTAGLRVTPHLLETRSSGLAPAATEQLIDRTFGGAATSRRIIALVEGATSVDESLPGGDAWAHEARRLQRVGLAEGWDALATVLPSPQTQTRRLARLRELDVARVTRDLAAALATVGIRPDDFVAGLEPLRQPRRITEQAVRQSSLAWALDNHLRHHHGRWLNATYIYPKARDPGGMGRIVTALARRVGAEASPARVAVTGGAILEMALRRALERDLLLITAAALLLMLVTLSAYYRRWRPVAAMGLSLVIAWCLFGTGVRLLGLPLNLFTLLTVPFILGYGLDDLIYLRHRSRSGMAAALVTTGRAIALTSLTTAAGFGGLLLARFQGLRELGAGGCLAVGSCLAVSLLVAPALLTRLGGTRG